MRHTALAALALTAAPAAAIASPIKAVKIIATVRVGGTVDIVAPSVGQKHADQLDLSFIVDNRGSAGDSLGTAIMAHAAPDGCTIMVDETGPAFDATLCDNLSHDALRDVLPIARKLAQQGLDVHPISRQQFTDLVCGAGVIETLRIKGH